MLFHNPSYSFVSSKHRYFLFPLRKIVYVHLRHFGLFVHLPESLCLRYDFFLVSQSVRQGTVSPTNYHIIYDTSGFKPDHIQRLTYKLTHLYYNWQVCVPFFVCQQLEFHFNPLIIQGL